METTYHPGVVVSSLATSATTQNYYNFIWSCLLDIIRQNFIDYSEYIIYTGCRTDVCVYKGVHKMKEYKEKLIILLDKLTGNQIEYIYYLACKLFGHTPD